MAADYGYQKTCSMELFNKEEEAAGAVVPVQRDEINLLTQAIAI